MATLDKKPRSKKPDPHTDQHEAPKQTSQVRSSPGGGYPEENQAQAKTPVIPPEKQPNQACNPKTQQCEATLGNPPPKK